MQCRSVRRCLWDSECFHRYVLGILYLYSRCYYVSKTENEVVQKNKRYRKIYLSIGQSWGLGDITDLNSHVQKVHHRNIPLMWFTLACSESPPPEHSFYVIYTGMFRKSTTGTFLLRDLYWHVQKDHHQNIPFTGMFRKTTAETFLLCDFNTLLAQELCVCNLKKTIAFSHYLFLLMKILNILQVGIRKNYCHLPNQTNDGSQK